MIRYRPLSCRTFACLLLLAVPGRAVADGVIERIVPPVLERGTTTRIAVYGKNLDGAENLWSSLSDGVLEAKPTESHADRVVFEVTTKRSAPVGICGVRVATKHGLSNVQLLLVDDLPVRLGSASSKLSLPCSTWGQFREAAIDRYSFDASAGQELSFEAVASRFGKDADPLVTIRDARGKLVAERDNDPGLYFDSRFAVQIQAAGTYTVEIRDSRYRGSEEFQYVLRIGRFPAGRVAVPAAVGGNGTELRLPEVPGATFVENRPAQTGPYFVNVKRPGDDGTTWIPVATADAPIAVMRDKLQGISSAYALAVHPTTTFAFALSPLRANPFLALDALVSTGRAQPTLAVVPGVLCGVLKVPNEKQTFLIELVKNQSIYVRAEAKALNSPADLELTLVDRFGKVQRRGTDGKDEPTLEFTAPAAGFYGLAVRDQLRDGGPAFAYRLTVTESAPFAVTADVEGLTIPQGSWQPIPLTLTRGSAKGPIKLTLLNAPAGVSLTSDTFGDSEVSLVARLSATDSAPLGIRTLQILAESTDGRQELVRTTPLIDRQIINVDLIPLALREDQKRLPPSVADRFALQITPPSSFAFDLPEPTLTLGRYQHVDVPILTSRSQGFDGPIHFRAEGGQLADPKEGRTRVYALFPDATVQLSKVNGTIHSKILANLAKSRIAVTATGERSGRRVALTRTFELNLTTAFSVTAEPAKLSLLPGESAKVLLKLSRLMPFDGPVTIALPKLNGLTLPETLTIAKGQTSAEFTVVAAADAPLGRQAPQAHATATVAGYEEELRTTLLDVEVRKVEPPKKK